MKRDDKGRFIKGNTEGKKFSGGTAAAEGKKGGEASARAAKARKTLAETLRDELTKNAGNGMTKQEYIVAKCLETLAKGKCSPQDLKTMSEVLGELKQNINISGDNAGLVIKFGDDAYGAGNND